MSDDKREITVSNEEIDAWLNQQTNTRDEPSSIERLLEEVGKADSKPIRSRNDMTEGQLKELEDRLPSPIELSYKEVPIQTQVPSTPTPETCLSFGSIPQFAEIIFRPNGEIWLNTDTIQLAIQPGISRILLGQPQ